MELQTLLADILINAYSVGKQNANSITDKNERRTYLVAYEAALKQVSLDLGMAFKRMKKEVKEMEVME